MADKETMGDVFRRAYAEQEEAQGAAQDELEGGAQDELEGGAQDEPEKATGATEDAAEGAAEGEGEIRTLSQLAEAIGADPADLYALEFTLANTGEKLTLGQIKDKLQEYSAREQEVLRARDELLREQQSFLSGAQALQEQDTEYTSVMNEAARIMAQADADFQRIDWEKFDQLDPLKSMNEKQKLMSRFVAAQQRLQQAQQAHNQVLTEKTTQARSWHDAQTLEAIPEWRDSEVVQKEVPEILAYARGVGFTDQEIAQAWDFRYRTVLRDAMLYRQLRTKARGLSAKSVKPLPTGLAREKAQSQRVADLVNQAKGSGNRELKRKAQAAILTQALSRGKR